MKLTTHRRRIALRAAIETLRARFGPGIIRHVGDLLAPAPGAARLLPSTGSLGIDLLVGGLPRGAISEYAGVEGAGSETLALTALARCQQVGGLVMLLDAEGTADPDALFAAGLDLHALIVACPVGAQEAWSALIALVGSGALDLVVLALPALYALPGAPPGGSPPRALERLRLALRGRSTTVLVTNAPEPTWGGRRPTIGQALAQAASLRLALHGQGPIIAPHGSIVGLRTLVTVSKFHGLPLGSFVRLEMTARGPRHAAELFALGRLTGCLTTQPAGLAVDNQVIGRSPEQAMRCLEADPALAAHLETAIRVAWEAPRPGVRTAR